MLKANVCRQKIAALIVSKNQVSFTVNPDTYSHCNLKNKLQYVHSDILCPVTSFIVKQKSPNITLCVNQGLRFAQPACIHPWNLPLNVCFHPTYPHRFLLKLKPWEPLSDTCGLLDSLQPNTMELHTSEWNITLLCFYQQQKFWRSTILLFALAQA